MNKIPTLYVRDPANMSRVTHDVTPGCEWVLRGEGLPTIKIDGTNVRVTVAAGVAVKLEKRRNPSRDEKAAGAEPGYVEAFRHDPADRHIFAALDASNWRGLPDGEYPCEAVGPKIQGGAGGSAPGLYCFTISPTVIGLANPRGFDAIREFLTAAAIEGIVWHHPDGRMAKIKSRDFGIPWLARPAGGADATPEQEQK